MSESNREYDFLASRLAEDIATEEQQLEELGAGVFSSAKLIELRGRFQERLEQFEYWQNSLIKIAIWSPLFLVTGALLMYFHSYRVGWFLIVMFPALLVISLAAIFLMYRNFGSKGRIEGWLESVQLELEKRKKASGK